jgi:hypothetical protein
LSTDCYAILGVSPKAEDVVIGAAYRALMRHYHPDTNPDPEAQAKAQAITAAYAILRDPAKRADYDAQRAADDLWSEDDDEAPRKPPPAMRTVGIALAALALALVAMVWTLAERQPAPPADHTPMMKQDEAGSQPMPAEPVVQLEPESERLARLREEAEILTQGQAPPAEEIVAAEPVIAPKASPGVAVRAPPSRRKAMPAPVPPRQVASKPKAAPPKKDERLATVETMAAGYFTQSMANASDAKKELLVGARDRSAAKRKACRSDSCIADAYVRQIRETSAIMESGATTPK